MERHCIEAELSELVKVVESREELRAIKAKLPADALAAASLLGADEAVEDQRRRVVAAVERYAYAGRRG